MADGISVRFVKAYQPSTAITAMDVMLLRYPPTGEGLPPEWDDPEIWSAIRAELARRQPTVH